MIAPWPARESVATLALLRLGLALLILVDTACTWRYSSELYSHSGPALPYFQSPPALDGGLDNGFPGRGDSAPPEPQLPLHETPFIRSVIGSGGLVPPPGPAIAAQSLLLFAAVSLAVGWCSGLSLLVCGVVLAWLRPLDLSWTFAKPTVIWLHMLLLLALGECGGWLTRATRWFATRPPAASGMSRWLLQVLACQIYSGAALTKLQSGWFASGELLQYALLDRQYGGTTWGRWVAATPGLTRPLSLATLLLELLFPVLIWVPRWRVPLLGAAALFHLGVWACLHVDLFSPTMLVLLLSFVEPGAVRDWIQRRFPRAIPAHSSPDPSLTTQKHGQPVRGTRARWVWMAMAVAGLGTFVQWSADWYGVFGRTPRPPLIETTRAVLGEMTRRVELPPDWSIHRVALGTRVISSGVWGNPEQAQRGDSVFVRLQFSVPHRPIRLEGVLLDDDGTEWARFEHAVAADVSHTLDGFALTTDLPSGGGRVLLLVDGEELTSRPVRWDH